MGLNPTYDNFGIRRLLKMKIILIILVLPVQMIASVELRTMWNLYSKEHFNLTLTCEIYEPIWSDVNFYSPNDGLTAYCEAPDWGGKCISRKNYASIKQFAKRGETELILYGQVNKNTYEGIWKCEHGKDSATAFVPHKPGFNDLLNVNIDVSIETKNDSTTVMIACFSNRPILRHYVEILINSLAKDFVRYDNEQCYHQDGECKETRCKCFPTENRYEWVGDVKYQINNVSCQQSFLNTVTKKIFTNTKTKTFREKDPPDQEDKNGDNLNISVEMDTKKTKDTPVQEDKNGDNLNIPVKMDTDKTQASQLFKEIMAYNGIFFTSMIPVYFCTCFYCIIKRCLKCTPKRSLFLPTLHHAVSNSTPGIKGVALLADDTVAIIYYDVKRVTLIKNIEYSHDLETCPRGMTRISNIKIALTFDNEKKIRIFRLHSLNLEEEPSINLKKNPHSITYDNGFFAVECGESFHGCIAIINNKNDTVINIKKRRQWYLTGNTIRLALDAKSEKLYVSSAANGKVYKVNYTGQVLSMINVACSRDILFIHSMRVLLGVSNVDKKICAVDDKDRKYTLLNKKILKSNDKIDFPEYISYNWENNDLHVCVTFSNGSVKIYKIDYTPKSVILDMLDDV